MLFLLGTEMDYKADKMQSQFIFNNPNQIGACGCGESVQLTAAKIDGRVDVRGVRSTGTMTAASGAWTAIS